MNSDEESGKGAFQFKTTSETDGKSIQEMIAEALMMSPKTDHSGDVSGSFHVPASLSDDPEQANVSFFNGNQESLIVGRLLLQYKNLDLRLSRVEEYVYKSPSSNTINTRSPGMKRTRNVNQNQILSETYPNTQSDNEMDNQSNSINPILTTSSALLSYPLSSSMAASLSSSTMSLPSAASSSRRYAAKRKDDIKVKKQT